MISHAFKRLRRTLIINPMLNLAGWYFRVSPKMITCRQLNDLIYDHTEGNLTEKQTALFERHTRVCPICRNFHKTYMATYKTKSHISPHSHLDVPSEVPQNLINAIEDIRDV